MHIVRVNAISLCTGMLKVSQELRLFLDGILITREATETSDGP